MPNKGTSALSRPLQSTPGPEALRGFHLRAICFACRFCFCVVRCGATTKGPRTACRYLIAQSNTPYYLESTGVNRQPTGITLGCADDLIIHYSVHCSVLKLHDACMASQQTLVAKPTQFPSQRLGFSYNIDNPIV